VSSLEQARFRPEKTDLIRITILYFYSAKGEGASAFQPPYSLIVLLSLDTTHTHIHTHTRTQFRAHTHTHIRHAHTYIHTHTQLTHKQTNTDAS